MRRRALPHRVERVLNAVTGQLQFKPPSASRAAPSTDHRRPDDSDVIAFRVGTPMSPPAKANFGSVVSAGLGRQECNLLIT